MAVEEIGGEIEQTDDHFAHELGDSYMQQHAGVGFEHRHVEHKEGKRQQEIDIVDQQGRIL